PFSAATASLEDLRSTYQAYFPAQNDDIRNPNQRHSEYRLPDFDFSNIQPTSGLSAYTSNFTRPPTPYPEPHARSIPSLPPQVSLSQLRTGMASALDPDLHTWWTTINISHSFMISTSTGFPLSLEFG